MRLLGETGREDEGENDNLMGARVPAARLMLYVYSIPTPTDLICRLAGRSILVGRTLVNNINCNKKKIRVDSKKLPKIE